MINKMKLLLIDDRIDQLDTFIQGINETTEVILYSFENDTYESIASQKKYEDYETVGIVSHNYNDPVFQLLMKEKIGIFSDMNTWTPFINFLTQFKTPIVDLMACKIFSEANWQTVFNYIEETAMIDIRGSSDDTGNTDFGGNWVMESDNVDIKELYFTDLIENYTGILAISSYNRYYGDYNNKYEDDDFMVVSTQYGYAILVKSLGRVWNAGYSNLQNGVWILGTDNQILDNVTSVYSNQTSFCAIDDNGYVYAWGFNGFGAFETGYAERVKTSDDNPIQNIISVTSTLLSFTALSSDGKVYSWGSVTHSGINPSYATQVSTILSGPLLDITKVFAAQFWFFAIDTSGQLYKWSYLSSTQYAIQVVITGTITPVVLLSDKLATINFGISGVGTDGYLYAMVSAGAQDSMTKFRVGDASTGPFLENIETIYGTGSAFSAIDSTGNVYTWGSGSAGGIAATFATQLRIGNASTGPFLGQDSPIISITPNNTAFSALDSTGNVYAWGSGSAGGIATTFATQLRIGNASTGPFLGQDSPVLSITPNTSAFSVLDGTGNVYSWGSVSDGGIANSFATQVRIGDASTGPFLGQDSPILSITPNNSAFSALDSNKSLYVWGSATSGGGQPTYATMITYTNPIKAVINNTGAFLLIDEFKNFVIFGSVTSGGRNLINLVELNVVEKKADTDPVLDISSNNVNNFIFKNDNGSFIIGQSFNGGLNNSYASKILDSNSSIVSNTNANAFIDNGNVYIWGVYLNLSVPTLVTLEDGTPITNIVSITKSVRSFIFTDILGNLYCIGDPLDGGISSTFATQLRVGSTGGAYLDNITSIISSDQGRAFAAIGDTGYVYAYGNNGSGGINPSFATQVRVGNGSTGPFLEDIVSINSNTSTFTAIGSTGSVYSWGSLSTGLLNNSFATQVRVGNASTGPFLGDVVSVTSNGLSGIAAIVGSTGSVYVWGSSTNGGINNTFATRLRVGNASTGPFLGQTFPIISIASNIAAFAALDSAGYVYAWGSGSAGGIAATFATQVRVGNASTGPFLGQSSPIVSISSFAAGFAFTALDNDGYVYAWGSSLDGGITSTFATQVRVGNASTGPFLGQSSPIVYIANNANTFSAIDSDGYVYVWGTVSRGGIATTFATQLRINNPITGEFLVAGPGNKIVSNFYGYAVLANDGQVYSWGEYILGVGPSLNFATKINKFSFEPYVNPTVEATELEVTYKDYEFTVGQVLDKAVPDPETKGIAVTSAPATNGLWKYKTDSFWQDVPDVSETSSLPLLADSSLQFIPSGSYDGSAEFSFKPWSGLIVEEEELFDSTIPNLGIVSESQVDVTVNDIPEPPEPEEKSNAMTIILIVFAVLIIVAVIFIFFAPAIINFFSSLIVKVTNIF